MPVTITDIVVEQEDKSFEPLFVATFVNVSDREARVMTYEDRPDDADVINEIGENEVFIDLREIKNEA